MSSEFFREVMKIYDGPSPDINLFNEKNNGLSIKKIISSGLVNSVHDISSGGILVALSKMCISGKIGAKIKISHNKINLFEYLFGEDQSRYLIEIKEENKDKVSNILKENSIYFEIIGKTQKENIVINKDLIGNVKELSELYSCWFKKYFE